MCMQRGGASRASASAKQTRCSQRPENSLQAATENSLYFPPPVCKGQAAQQEVASFSLLNGFNVMSRNVSLEQQDGSTAYDAQTPG